eukprot:TRINITY_DN240_c0_g1_i1.p1 TRINITY_DN240_c0_g1~~TRINITY_DN240_c0_g1_i1.p1  ORF type:complete len:874 (+),score=515.90 TRINITY_DN240_c0_g1_i1:38-2623(+)
MATGRYWRQYNDQDFFSDNEDYYSSSESETDSEGEEDVHQENEEAQKQTGRFLKGSSFVDSDDEEYDDGQRTIKSQKDKVFEMIETSVLNIKASISAENWNEVLADFEKLVKQIEKNENVVRQYGVPPKYVEALIELEEAVGKPLNQSDEPKKNLSATNSKSLNAMRQRIKKFNKLNEILIQKYKENPESVLRTPTAQEEEKDKEEEDDAWTAEKIEKHLLAHFSQRGKKGYEKAAQVKVLTDLAQHAQEINEKTIHINILLHLFNAYYDSIYGGLSNVDWKKCIFYLREIFTITSEDRKILEQAESSFLAVDSEDEPAGQSATLIVLLERLNRELVISFQNLSPHSREYIERMYDISSILAVAQISQDYYQQKKDNVSAAKAATIRLEHAYYLSSSLKYTIPASSPFFVQGQNNWIQIVPKDIVPELTEFVLKNGNERSKAHALLYHIYHLAIVDNFHEARDLMLLSHLQETIYHADIATQILYNRALVQIGLCAFRHGLISDAFNCLNEICNSQQFKALIGQGKTVTSYKQMDKKIDMERQEKKHQVPLHMSINLDLIEAVHFCTTILIDIPVLAANPYDFRKRSTSKSFKRFFQNDRYQSHYNSGTAESTREHFITASRAMNLGDWQQASDIVTALPFWDSFANANEIRTMLAQKFKEETLRTFVFAYHQSYDSLGIEDLTTYFNIEADKIIAIVSKMILSEELMASFDPEASVIIFHKMEPSRLQSLALQYADKLSSVVGSDRQNDGRSYHSHKNYDGKSRDNDQWNQNNSSGNYRGNSSNYRGNNQNRNSSNYRGNNQNRKPYDKNNSNYKRNNNNNNNNNNSSNNPNTGGSSSSNSTSSSSSSNYQGNSNNRKKY